MQITELQKEQTITIVKDSMFSASIIHCKVESIKTEKYAQYDTSHVLYFKAKGKRKVQGIRIIIGNSEKTAIFLGHVDIKSSMFGETKQEFGMTIKESKYASCDSRYFTDALATTKEKPVMLFNFKPEILSSDKFKFTVVTENGVIFKESEEDLINFCNEVGFTYLKHSEENFSSRVEIRKRPIFRGLIGAMYDGLDDRGFHVVRYETPEINRMLSI